MSAPSNNPIWHANAARPQFSPLPGPASADVCVIGAGIAGLSTAYMLQRARKSVIVIDALGIGAGASGRSSAHFLPPDERYFEIERNAGAVRVQLVADSYRQAINCVQSIVRTERIECEFERLDAFQVSPNRLWNDTLEREYAVTSRLGLDVRRLERVPGLGFDTGPCLRFANQAQFHPLKYLNGLARGIVRMGGQIFGATRALGVAGDNEVQHVQTEGGAIAVAAVVMATNTRIDGGSPAQSYVVAVRVPRDALPRLLLWGTGAPCYYVRLANGPAGANYELLIVRGQDSIPGDATHAQQRYDTIETWIRLRFTMAGMVDYRWSGEVTETAAAAPLLARHAPERENVYAIHADSGNGMTSCTAGAIVVSDLILGHKNPWTALYLPGRGPVQRSGDFDA